jgi:hypothetical protein|eukprot:COSAG01_NODE_3993_length_5456_cov_28.008774_7_plen_75_part_00
MVQEDRGEAVGAVILRVPVVVRRLPDREGVLMRDVGLLQLIPASFMIRTETVAEITLRVWSFHHRFLARDIVSE